ncbi:MAG TPA: serine hydrolase domain-containing protein [Acidimicrobiia bacterium]|nr:serine hydrolase domain-containing protein [Acidimicrobiia bacterium]
MSTSPVRTLDEQAMHALVDRAHREIDSGLLPSCQLALGFNGEIVLEETLGDATSDSRYVIFSCTKAIVASAVWLLIGDDRLQTSARVADIVPEFATFGKDVVTVEQLLTHTSGFPHAPLGPPDWYTREARLARFAKWRLTFEPGTAFEYHPTAAHWVLAELIERIAGVDYREFVRVRILEALGLRRLELGVRGEPSAIATIVGCGEPAPPDELQAAIGARELPVTEVTEEVLLGFNEPANLELGVPGGGAVSSAADLARFYQALLHDSGGLWDHDVLRSGTSEVLNRFPNELGVAANRTLGLVVAGDDGQSAARGMGHTVSASAFGHNGAGGQIAWADPGTGLSFVYLTNGLDRNALREWRRTSGLASRAATCAANVS